MADTEHSSSETQTQAETPAKNAKTYTLEQTHEFLSLVKDENAAYRERLRTITAENEQYKSQLEQMTARHTEEIAQQAQAFKLSNAKADLTALAIKAGLNDPSDLDHFDISQVEIGEDGKVKDASKVIENLQKAKPHYFGSVSNSSVAQAPSADAKTAPATAYDMSDAEWKAKQKARGLL